MRIGPGEQTHTIRPAQLTKRNSGKPDNGTDEAWPTAGARYFPRVPAGRHDAQNLMLPIMPAMFVVSSLIVGATVEEAR